MSESVLKSGVCQRSCRVNLFPVTRSQWAVFGGGVWILPRLGKSILAPSTTKVFSLSHAETFCSSFSRRLTGFKITSAIGDQFLVPPDHRAGFFRLASS